MSLRVFIPLSFGVSNMGGKFLHNCIKGFACLAIALFAMANKPCFASSEVSFGYYVDSTSDSCSFNDTSLSLYDYISGTIDYNGSTFDYSSFRSLFSSLGFDSYFLNWNSGSPEFYFSIVSDSRRTLYIFTKSISSLSSNTSALGNGLYNFSYSGPILVRPFVGYTPVCFSVLPSSFDLSISYEFSDPFVVYVPDSSSTPSSYSYMASYGGVSYTCQWVRFSSSVSLFDDFLNSSDNFCYVICVSSEGSYELLNTGVALNASTFICPFTCIPIFESTSSLTYGSQLYLVSSSARFLGLRLNYNYSLGVPFDYFVPGLSFRGSPALPTPLPSPTSIPPWRDSDLPTPTAYPSVTVAPLPTGIVTDYIPLLDLPSSESTLSNITGIIKEFNSIFSRKVFALGSYTLQVMYYFSGWFKFIFLVPAGVFIAFLIGRLRKK